MNSPSRSTDRYLYIDVPRGWAALCVVYQHASEIAVKSAGVSIHSAEKFVIDFLTGPIGIGEIGVCIFLMISGFVVPFSLLRYTSDPIRNFVAHRFFRLYPAYWLSVALGTLFVWWRFGVQNGGREIDWPIVLANLSMLQAFFGIDDVMGQYWTLSLELLFYAVCVALFALGRLGSFKSVLLVLFGLIAIREGARHVPDLPADLFRVISYFRYIGFMFFGLLYRKWLLDRDANAGRDAIIVLAVTFLMFGVVNDARRFFVTDILALRTQLTHLAAIAIFTVFTRCHRPSNTIGAFLGKISYSVYLFHPIVIYPLWLYWFQSSSSLRASPHLFIFLSMLIAILFSSLTYRLIEKPFVAFGKRHFPREPGSSVMLQDSPVSMR